MHELTVVEGMMDVVLRHAEENRARQVTGVSLRIGEMHGVMENLFVNAFRYLSRNTICDGARLSITWSPVVFQCASCARLYPVNAQGNIECSCPFCGGEASMVSGGEFDIEEIEMLE